MEEKRAFAEACENGNLERVKELYPVVVGNGNSFFESSFCKACWKGHLNVAVWLYSVNPSLNVSVNNEWPFRFACQNGHLEVAKWLLSIKPSIDISIKDEYAFRYACKHGQLSVAKWLLSVKPDINIMACEDTNEDAWVLIGQNNDKQMATKMALWLMSVASQNIEIGIPA